MKGKYMRYRIFASSLIMIFAVLVLTMQVGAQDSTMVGWKRSLVTDFTITQASYSDSWSGGEAGSVNWVANLGGSAEKGLKPWFDFKTTLRLSFGQTLTQDAETKNWSKPKKSTDLIDWENVGSFTLHKWVDPYVAFRLESQFLDASNEAKKLYFTPIKLTESAGVKKNLYEQDKNFVSTRLGLALRQILRRSAGLSIDAILTTFDTTLIDGGFESVTDAEFHINDKLSYVGKLSLYKAFYFSEKDNVAGTSAEDDWKAVDVNWENSINAYLTKIITVKLYTQLLYDKEISAKGRFKETLGIGFVFRLI
ncbi:MAG: DUF3078 domain-containing protein [bacterium]